MTPEEAISKAKQMRKEREEALHQWWESEHRFETVDDIREIPKTDDPDKQKYYQERVIAFGAIPKNQLITGHTYIGKCRNAHKAVWNGTVFIYERHKFGFAYPEEINHFQDDDGYDLFIPIRDISDDLNIDSNNGENA